MTEEKNTGSALPILFLVVMIDMIGFGIVIPFLTYFIEDLATLQGVTELGLWVGLMMVSYSVAQFLFSPLWGSLSDRLGRKPIILVGLVGNTVFFTLFGISTSLLMALFARFCAGAFNANIAVAKAWTLAGLVYVLRNLHSQTLHCQTFWVSNSLCQWPHSHNQSQ